MNHQGLILCQFPISVFHPGLQQKSLSWLIIQRPLEIDTKTRQSDGVNQHVAGGVATNLGEVSVSFTSQRADFVFKKFVASLLKPEVQPMLDACQFAYKHKRSTEDAILCMLHFISKHLKETKAYVRILFIDFSSAFNTVQPHLLLEKLKDMNVNTTLIRWFYSFLTDRTQQVKVQSDTVRHQTL